jgi:hypothetical protein
VSSARAQLAVAGAAVLAGLVLLLYCIHASGFWIDELYTLHAIRLPWRDMVLERLKNGHFPAYFSIVKLIYESFPHANAELVLRLPSTVAWLAAVGSFALLARRFLASAAASATAVILFALNLMVMRQADEARMYTVVLFLAVWMIRCYLELNENSPQRRWRVLFPLITMAAYAISSSSIILTVSMLIDSLRRRRTAPRLWIHVLLSLGMGALVFIPGAVMHLHTAERAGIAGTKRIQILAHWITVLAGVQAEDDYIAARLPQRIFQAIAAVITLLICIGWWRSRKVLPRAVSACAALVLIPFCLMIAAEPISEISTFRLLGPPRYLVSILPAAALLVASVSSRYLQGARRHVVLNGALAVFLLSGSYFFLTTRTEPIRERVQEMAKHYSREDAVVVVPEEIADGVEMYGREVRVDLAINRKLQDRAKIAGMLAPLKDHPKLWLVWYRGQDSPVLEICQELFGAYESNNKKKAVGSLRIFEFTPGGSSSR